MNLAHPDTAGHRAPRASRRPMVAMALLLVGVLCLILWRVLSGDSGLPYRSDASAPPTAQVTKNKVYSLAVPGGVRVLRDRGVPTVAAQNSELLNLQCTYSGGGSVPRALAVNAESTQTKAENTVAHFIAPLTGPIHVDCDGWGTMFIPDSDNRPADTAGWLLVIATVTLTIGAGLGLSALRTSHAQRSATASEDDEIERLVDVAPIGADDGEVRAADRDDVGE
jgi:hypothetical protein